MHGFHHLCQGEGRGFESRRPLQTKSRSAGVCAPALFLPNHLHRAPIARPRCADLVRLRFMLDTVAPVAARHFPARFRYLGDTGSGTCTTLSPA